jgi:hypothetical protein
LDAVHLVFSFSATMSENTPDAAGQQNAPQAVIEKVSRDGLGNLEVRVKGRADPAKDARVSRCFPWSLPDTYISIRDNDGKEITMLHSLAELDSNSRAVVEEELRDKVFNPIILRVVEHKRDFGASSKRDFGVRALTVETDRGEVTFHIKSRDDVRILSPVRALFRDPDGNVYEVPNLAALDEHSRQVMEEYF